MCPLSGVERFPLLGGFQCTNFGGRAIGPWVGLGIMFAI